MIFYILCLKPHGKLIKLPGKSLRLIVELFLSSGKTQFDRVS